MNKIISNLVNDLFSETKTLMEVKKLIVEYGLVKEFVEYCNNTQKFNGMDDLLAYSMYYNILEMNGPDYTFSNFYEGLFEENKLGISV